MAGFFLMRSKNERLNICKALDAFEQNGLTAPAEYQLGEHRLYLFSKLTARKPCSLETEYGFCAVVGTYIYKGYDYELSLEHTLQDHYAGKLSLGDMYGQFTLILYVKDRLCMVSDTLYCKHFFSDRGHSFFSSSFFAAAEAVGDVTINDMAVFEKMLTGVIVSPDTLVNEVVQMNREEQKKANKTGSGITFLVHPDLRILPPHDHGREASVRKQAANIRRYFRKLAPALSKDRVDLGLSAGHDSSLLFAVMASDYKDGLHIHTHSTGHVHDREKNAAIKMAEVKGIRTTVVPTPRLDESGVELQRLLRENLVFFDGRTSFDIGGFSATYRAAYRLEATEGCPSTLTGVGGECLRNAFSVRGRRLNAGRFFFDKIYSRSFMNAAPGDLIEKVSKHHIAKAEKILKTRLRGTVDRLSLRRYYSEILMPEGQGNVIDAYSTVSNCIAPFLDIHILCEAYRGIRYLGNCGEYESAVICTLDPEIGACINANNGYPFDHIPLTLRIKEAVRASVSSQLWERLNRLRAGNNARRSEYFINVMKRDAGLRRAFGEFRRRYPGIDLMTAAEGESMSSRAAYLSLTVRKLTNGL